MKGSIRIGCKFLCAVGFILGSLPVAAEDQSDAAWLEDLWRDHLLWRADELMPEQPIYAEILCREVLKGDPGHRQALNRLTRIYAAKGEGAMMAMTARLGRDVHPEDASWADTLRLAEQRIAELPTAPSDAELANPTNKFTTYLQEALHTRRQDRNLMISEVALRALLLDYPRNLTVIEELAETYRLTREWTLCAMANRFGLEAYPENRGFFRNYLGALRLMGRADLGWNLARERLTSAEPDPGLLQQAAVLAAAAREIEAFQAVLSALPPTVTGDALLDAGRGLIPAQRYGAAVPLLLAAHERMPARHEPVYDLAVLFGLMDARDECLEMLRKLRNRVPAERYAEMVGAGPFPNTVRERAVMEEAGDDG